MEKAVALDTPCNLAAWLAGYGRGIVENVFQKFVQKRKETKIRRISGHVEPCYPKISDYFKRVKQSQDITSIVFGGAVDGSFDSSEIVSDKS